MDCCDSFLDERYASVIVDAFSRWLEIGWTTLPATEFTPKMLCTSYSVEKVYLLCLFLLIMATDSFAKHVTNGRHFYTAPRHSKCNGLAENFVCTKNYYFFSKHLVIY